MLSRPSLRSREVPACPTGLIVEDGCLKGPYDRAFLTQARSVAILNHQLKDGLLLGGVICKRLAGLHPQSLSWEEAENCSASTHAWEAAIYASSFRSSPANSRLPGGVSISAGRRLAESGLFLGRGSREKLRQRTSCLAFVRNECK